MQYRRLGKSSLVVSAMGLGCMGMSQSYGTPDDAESTATIHHAIDRGVTLIDTADMYGGGANEELVGRAIAKRRNEIILATKFGNMRQPDGRFLGVNGRPEYVQSACEASLERLKISAIDLFYLHRVDTNVPIEDTVGAMARLIEQGKVRYLGLSEAGAQTIRRAHATYPIAALQSEYSLWTRDPEGGILDTCRELGIGFVPYSPLGRGILTGKVKSADFGPKDFRRMSPRFQGENFEKNLQLVARIEQIAAEKHCTPAQLALAWVLAQGGDIVPIPGTKRRTYLDQNLSALDISLTPAELRRIDEIAPRGAAVGARYPVEYMNRLGV
ncbi:MAG: aldo/keto reductase [Candidatus Acidiferrales bacterium]|jgi:aryl-alcohol dehydrogenase-like predicted oxidoreductase